MLGLVRTMAVRLATFEIWPVALGVAAGAALTRALPVALALAGCFWIVRWVAYGRPSVHTPGDWGIDQT